MKKKWKREGNQSINELGKEMEEGKKEMHRVKPGWLVRWDMAKAGEKKQILRKGDGVSKCFVTGRVLPSNV